MKMVVFDIFKASYLSKQFLLKRQIYCINPKFLFFTRSRKIYVKWNQSGLGSYTVRFSKYNDLANTLSIIHCVFLLLMLLFQDRLRLLRDKFSKVFVSMQGK